MKFQLALLKALIAAAVFVHAVPISRDELVENSAKGLRLLQLSEHGLPVWKTEDEVLQLLRSGARFFDVTETYEIQQELDKTSAESKNAGEFSTAATFSPPSHQSQVTPLLSRLSISNMQSYLSSLSGFNNRYYRSQSGADASAWLLDTVQDITRGRSDITASAFTHGWPQSSTIVKIAGSSSSGPVTILGAHMDSINLSNPMNGRAPGSDDDGTGTVNLIETLRVLVSSGFRPSTPLEFHWYSGEEGGLLGSNAIATSYKRAGTQVKAFLQLDMTGYVKPGTPEVVAIMPDFIDQGLNNFLKQLVTTYSRLPVVVNVPCGYACSDHASWFRQGYPTALPFEGIFGEDDPFIHSSGDTTSVNGFSWSHSLEFAKIAVAFAYELTA